MKALARNSRWVAGIAGLALLQGGSLSASEGSQMGSYQTMGEVSLVYAVGSYGNSIAVNEEGETYLGSAISYRELPLGLPPFPYGPYPAGLWAFVDGVVVGHAPDGQRFLWQYVGGSQHDHVAALAADSSGVYAVVDSMNTEDNGISVQKLIGHTVALPIYSTGVVGGHWASANDISVDSSGNAYVTGRNGSGYYAGWDDHYGDGAYVVKLDRSGDRVYYYELDGQGQDEGLKIAADNAGNAYVSGTTNAPDFPVTGDPDGAACSSQQFVAKLDPAGNVVYSRCYDEGWILEIAAAENGGLYLARAANSEPRLAIVRLDAAGSVAETVDLGEIPIRFGEAGFLFGPAGSFYVYGSSSGCAGTVLARLSPAARVATSVCLSGVNLTELAVDPRGDAYVLGEITAEGGYFPDRLARTYVLARFAFPSNLAPDCSAATGSPSSVWPPNGRLVPVSLHGVTDPDGDPVTFTVTSIRQDERPQGTADGFGTGTPNASVRASRNGSGDGRVYHLGFEASDGKGGLCQGTVAVCVPHNQGRGNACGNGGSLFDSTRP